MATDGGSSATEPADVAELLADLESQLDAGMAADCETTNVTGTGSVSDPAAAVTAAPVAGISQASPLAAPDAAVGGSTDATAESEDPVQDNAETTMPPLPSGKHRLFAAFANNAASIAPTVDAALVVGGVCGHVMAPDSAGNPGPSPKIAKTVCSSGALASPAEVAQAAPSAYAGVVATGTQLVALAASPPQMGQTVCVVPTAGDGAACTQPSPAPDPADEAQAACAVTAAGGDAAELSTIAVPPVPAKLKQVAIAPCAVAAAGGVAAGRQPSKVAKVASVAKSKQAKQAASAVCAVAAAGGVAAGTQLGSIASPVKSAQTTSAACNASAAVAAGGVAAGEHGNQPSSSASPAALAQSAHVLPAAVVATPAKAKSAAATNVATTAAEHQQVKRPASASPAPGASPPSKQLCAANVNTVAHAVASVPPVAVPHTHHTPAFNAPQSQQNAHAVAPVASVQPVAVQQAHHTPACVAPQSQHLSSTLGQSASPSPSTHHLAQLAPATQTPLPQTPLHPQPSVEPVEAALATLTYEQIWGVRQSINERFPGMDPSTRWNVCMRLYVKQQASREVIILLFSRDGKKLHSRHPKINTRLQASAVIEYSAKFMVKGYLHSFAGPMFRCPDNDNSEATVLVLTDEGPQWYVGGGTRIQSWYHAISSKPDNINCRNAFPKPANRIEPGVLDWLSTNVLSETRSSAAFSPTRSLAATTSQRS
jgi:hypothetical protein